MVMKLFSYHNLYIRANVLIDNEIINFVHILWDSLLERRVVKVDINRNLRKINVLNINYLNSWQLLEKTVKIPLKTGGGRYPAEV